jgi:ABC-type uncharacterized transport system ATPase subunit
MSSSEINPAPLLHVKELSRDFGGLRAVASISFEVLPGEIVGLIGPNGAGKTTLFALLTHCSPLKQIKDEHDYVYIVDRLKELIKSKGLQVAPAEIEHILVGHPGVLDAAVIAEPHPDFGEEPVA